MSDQAEALRTLRAVATRAPLAAGARGVIAVGSGKGGVGKSVVSVWLAAALARRGRRVLLVDGALTHGHLHLLLGRPAATGWWRFLRGELEAERLVERAGERLWLLPADSAGESLHHLGPLELARLHYRITALFDHYDAVVVDSGPGLDGVVRAATLRAGRLVLVTLPEAAALADAYAVIKRVHVQVPTLPMDVIVNRIEPGDDPCAAFASLRSAAERFLGRPLGLLATLPEQPGMRARLRTPGALLDAVPADLAAAIEPLVGVLR